MWPEFTLLMFNHFREWLPVVLFLSRDGTDGLCAYYNITMQCIIIGIIINGSLQGVPVLKISDPNPIFQIAPLPTHPLRHIAYYNDIHNQNLNIHTVNYIHMWFYLCMNIINILMILNLVVQSLTLTSHTYQLTCDWNSHARSMECREGRTNS